MGVIVARFDIRVDAPTSRGEAKPADCTLKTGLQCPVSTYQFLWASRKQHLHHVLRAW